MGFNGSESTIADMLKAIDVLEKQTIEAAKDAARMSTQEFMDRTPVWSGKTAGSYAWGVGAGGGHSYEGGPTSKGEQTNKMGLPDGESNRPGAEESALGALEDVLSGFAALGPSLVMTNTSPIWDLVDGGSAPTANRSRCPGGVATLAEQAIRDKLGDNFR